MNLPPALRALLPLVIGLVVGGVGVSLFMESMPGSEGSPQERADQLDRELKRAQNRIAALEAAEAQTPRAGHAREDVGALKEGARRIVEDIREGRPVSPDEIFRASQPLMRDLAPLFDRMRVKQQRELIDSMTGELARKYALTPEGQQALKQWFDAKSNEEAKRWTEMLGKDGTRLEDVMRASRDVRPDEGLDAFMPTILSGEKLTAFQTERMGERVQRVEHEADAMVQRLDGIVTLNDTQRDQVFGIMARGSKEYAPTMVLDGAHGPIPPTPAGDRNAAMLAVLNPDQRAAYEVEKQRRREAATKDMEAMGLTLPTNWEMLEFSP